jgi:glycosyltransferase involved in cell wall biosynthesis
VRVAYFGTWERGYPRNEQVISALRGAGAEVELVHREVWTREHKFAGNLGAFARLLAAQPPLALRRLPAEVDVLLVGYPGQLDVWAARRHGRPVVFNPMVSLYDTLAGDRGRVRPGSPAARALRELDRRSLRAADRVVADTRANAAYLAELAGIEEPAVCYVGAEERLFRPAWRRGGEFRVLFVGKLIPLHGLEAILEAARLLPEVPFRLVGSGQLEPLLAGRPANVEHVPWVAYERLPAEYAAAGCALGVFGRSEKAERVIPNKAFQALAVGVPLVTADTEAARELLGNGRDALLTSREPAEIAAAIRALRDDAALAERIGAAGRATYEREASEAVLGRRWLATLEAVA